MKLIFKLIKITLGALFLLFAFWFCEGFIEGWMEEEENSEEYYEYEDDDEDDYHHGDRDHSRRHHKESTEGSRREVKEEIDEADDDEIEDAEEAINNKYEEPTKETASEENHNENKVEKKATKEVNTINSANFKSKIANYTTSTSTCNKNVNAVILLYSDKFEASTKMLDNLENICNNNFQKDYNFFSLSLTDGAEVIKAYGLTDIPTLIVATNGTMYFKKGYLSEKDLSEYLFSLK